MKIHQFTHLFAPDQLAGASLYTDLALYLRERGHDIRVTTTFSYYPALRYAIGDRGVSSRDEDYSGIKMRRIGMFLPRRHTGLRRLGPELSYLKNLWHCGRFNNWTPDVVLAACPMLAQCIAPRFLYPGCKIPRLLIVQDFMADAAAELRILRGSTLNSILKRIECWGLNGANTLSTISDLMGNKLSRNHPKRRVVVIPNWIHQSLASTIELERAKASPRASRLLTYSGNLGVKQGLPQFVENFVSLRSGWRLEITGGGAEAVALNATALGRSQVVVTGVQLESEYVARLLTTTACLITQRSGITANFLPSKLLPALATGTPVLAVCDPTSPLGTEVQKGGFGVVVRPGDAVALQRVLDGWTHESRRLCEMGNRAFAWAERYRRERILPLYEHELERLIEPLSKS